jgi:molybdopterin-guanine dinucleotide biosynthesis protein MobB
MIPIISFIGFSGSGKTTIIEKAVIELKKRGIRIAVIKHSHRDDLDFDKTGKDSKRFSAAGAEIVVLSGPKEMALIKKTDHDLSPDEIVGLFNPDIDLVITEGFKSAGTLKIEVHRKALGPDLLTDPDQLLALITDELLNIQVPQFNVMKDNTVEIADLIEKWLSAHSKRGIKIQPGKEFSDMKYKMETIRQSLPQALAVEIYSRSLK